MQTKTEKKKEEMKKEKKLRAEDSGRCSSAAPAAQAHWLAWRPAPPSRRHRWKRSRPALRVPSVVLSSAARYSWPPAPGPGSPPPLPRRWALGGVRGVAVPCSARVPEPTRPPERRLGLGLLPGRRRGLALAWLPGGRCARRRRGAGVGEPREQGPRLGGVDQRRLAPGLPLPGPAPGKEGGGCPRSALRGRGRGWREESLRPGV